MSKGDVLRADVLAIDEHISVQDKRYVVQTRGVLEWSTHSVGGYRVRVENVQSALGEESRLHGARRSTDIPWSKPMPIQCTLKRDVRPMTLDVRA